MSLTERLLTLADEWDAQAAELDRRADAIPDSNNITEVSRGVLMSARAQALTDHARDIRDAVREAS